MSDEIEEDILLYLEFNEMLHPDIFNDKNLIFKTIGFDSEKPILQIGDEIYEGEFDYAQGTNVFFEKDVQQSNQNTDDIFDRKIENPVKYLCKTNKILKMNKIILKEKNENLKNDKNLLGEKQEFELSETYNEALEKLSEIAMNHLKENNEIDTGEDKK